MSTDAKVFLCGHNSIGHQADWVLEEETHLCNNGIILQRRMLHSVNIERSKETGKGKVNFAKNVLDVSEWR